MGAPTLVYDYVKEFTGHQEFDAVWGSLCGLYDTTTTGCQPLSDDWDAADYEALVVKSVHW